MPSPLRKGVNLPNLSLNYDINVRDRRGTNNYNTLELDPTDCIWTYPMNGLQI